MSKVKSGMVSNMKVNGLMVKILRKQILGQIKRRRKGYPPHGEFTEYLNIPYINDGNPQHTFDIFLAKENRKSICIIDIHGGSYIFGHHQDNYPFAYVFLKEGFDVVTLDYQPNDGKMDTKDLIDDVAKNINYLFAHLKEYNLENDQFVISGDSAGGHIALTITEALLDKEYAKELGYEFSNINIKACLVNGPVYDFVHIGEGAMTNSGMKRMFGPNYLDKEAFALICPKTHLSSLTCPLFVSTCKNDFLRLQSLVLNEDMKVKNNKFKFVDLDCDDKKVGHVHNVIATQLPESIEVNKAMMVFIEESIK